MTDLDSEEEGNHKLENRPTTLYGMKNQKKKGKVQDQNIYNM